MDFDNLPKLDLNYASNMLSQIQREQEESAMAIGQMHAERREREEQSLQANIEIAENTAEMKQDLKTVIHNQNNYIKMLEYQNQLLKNMFVSGEDGVAVQKEIMRILQEQGETDSTFKDKGLDAGIQAVFLGIQIWLKSKGIDF